MSAPELHFIDDGVMAFDPRDKTQRHDEPSTWKLTRNPALFMARITADYIGDYDPADFHWIKEMADYCDDKVPRADPA